MKCGFKWCCFWKTTSAGRFLGVWQYLFCSESGSGSGRLTHCTLPKDSFQPWFEGQKEHRKFVSTVSRIIFAHCTARLSRFRIIEEAICLCLTDYETVDHLIWHCERFETVRRCLADALTICAACESCPDEVLSGFPRKSCN
jgi:hypothetical protein